MKVRNGFVSNSSSSSFIVHCDGMKSPSTAQVAFDMLSVVADEHTDYGWELARNEIEALDWLRNNPSYDLPICISQTCNYPTFIFRDADGDIKIDTCHNHDWSLVDGLEYDGNGDLDIERSGVSDHDYLDLADMAVKSYEDYD